MFHMHDKNGLGSSIVPTAIVPMTGENGAPVPRRNQILTASLDPFMADDTSEVRLR
jgi:hypothetical protein